MKNLNPLLFLLLLTLIFAGCEKDEDKEPTKEQLIAAKEWKLSEAKMAGSIMGSAAELDAYIYMQPCQKDNFLKFVSGGKVTLDEGPSKCNTTSSQTQQGNWSINGDILTIDGAILTALGLPSSSPRNFTIVELTNQTLKLSLNESITLTIPSIPVPVTATSTNLTFAGQ